MSRFSFTKKGIEALKATGRREDHYDLGFRLAGVSFGVRVSEKGSKEYFVRYRDKYKKQRRMSLGDAKVKSLEKARDKATKIAKALGDGGNPAEELHQYKLAQTVDELCDLYLLDHAKFKKDEGAEDKRRLKKDVRPYIGQMKVCDVRRRDIIALIERVSIDRKAKVSSNRLRALLSKLFNFALERELIERSPCAGLPKKPKEAPKERVLSEKEIKALWAWLNTEPAANAAVFRLILLTAQRPMEVARMEWNEIQGDIWEIPGAKTKNGRSQTVPLSALALKSIESMMHGRRGRFVFPGERGEHVMPRTLQHVTERANEKLKGKRFTPHDLRRTAATYLRKLGISRDVVGSVLNHTHQGVTAVYDRHDLLPEMKEALHKWCAEVARISEIEVPKVKVRAIGRG
ncbi:MAG: tyrosine-type recombinase/integrase [SAR324 cluster bacterium]|uniref:Tyrosine-type recombinase/integrase n=1 Tax=SAR324 cluster bacterium TaxID=2024889 RepID=A0A7X9IKM6_9DELT|nr:tyrosine-type recombinase/integrase [SAR324 cluster bacterium]